ILFTCIIPSSILSTCVISFSILSTCIISFRILSTCIISLSNRSSAKSPCSMLSWSELSSSKPINR
ncbi:LOW QUALITY PROTEIN: hypothetical protein MXB_5246, partial [Myxobolus squamalis]